MAVLFDGSRTLWWTSKFSGIQGTCRFQLLKSITIAGDRQAKPSSAGCRVPGHAQKPRRGQALAPSQSQRQAHGPQSHRGCLARAGDLCLCFYLCSYCLLYIHIYVYIVDIYIIYIYTHSSKWVGPLQTVVRFANPS